MPRSETIYRGLRQATRDAAIDDETTVRRSWGPLVLHYFPRSDRIAFFPKDGPFDVTKVMRKPAVLALIDAELARIEARIEVGIR